MIAIFIFAVVVTTIFTSYNALFSGNKAIEQGSASYEMAKNCLSRMMMDLESIHVSLPPEYSPQDVADSPDLYRISGDVVDIQGRKFPKLRFTSMSHIAFGGKTQNGIAEIVYYVQEAEDERHVLRRADHLPPYGEFEENPADPALCDNVKSLAFIFYDNEATEHEKWDSEDREFEYATPAAVKIRLEIGNDSSSVLFETMVYFKIFRDMKR